MQFFLWIAHSPLPMPNPYWGGALTIFHPVGAALFECLGHLTPDHISGYGPGSGIGKSMYFSILFDYTCTFLQLSIE